MTLEQIHLDPLGGIAGDMFAAAMAAAFPEHVPGLLEEIRKLPAPEGAAVRFVAHAGHGIAGQRFVVECGTHPAHDHTPYREIRAQLASAGLARDVLAHAVELFARLAHAEASVHGVAPGEVVFHEAGAYDSVVDFVAAAYFIAKLAPARWSCAPLPLGGGRVRTAHGVLPVPAPATALLLQGLPVIDDGVAGERVTPTGAAIVRYLADLSGGIAPGAARRSKIVAASGHGFGTRTLEGIPNLLRCIAFEPAAAAGAAGDEDIATLHFEIDDQTAEDLASALEGIRAARGVLDASQLAIVGKKGRLATQVQVLVRPEYVDEVAAFCLAQTTTLGLRIGAARRRTLERAQVDAHGLRVKVARRPDGQRTAKAEMDDVAALGGDRASREEARTRAEETALGKHGSGHERD